VAWSVPPTAAANMVFTASQWNQGVRDNLAETAPAKATSSGGIFVTAGANSIAQREIASDYINAAETETSTTYTDLATAGPAVTVTTGPKALIWLSTQINNSSTNTSVMSCAVSGDTTQVASDGRAVLRDGGSGLDRRMGITNLFETLNSGSNTFTAKYRVSAATGTWQRRRLVVMAL